MTKNSYDVIGGIKSLRAKLTDKGYIEGRNLTIAARYADGDVDRVPALAACGGNRPREKGFNALKLSLS